MHLLNRRSFIASTAAGTAALAAGTPTLAAPTGFDVFTSSPLGFFVDSVVVVGDESVLVIDAQFAKADAVALADQIAATGKRLETIFITHIHPDHLMGVAVLKQRFPEATVTAHPAIAEILGQIGQGMFDGRKDLGGYAAGDAWVAPVSVDGNLTLEGETFEVLEPMQGDTPLITPVVLPQFDAIVASDIVYNGVDLWVAETLKPEDFAGWRSALDAIEARSESIIIPGHLAKGAQSDASGIAYTREKLDLWETALGQSTDRASLAEAIRTVMNGNPDDFFFQMALAAAYPA